MHKLILNTVKPRFTAGFGVQNFAQSVEKAFIHKGDISDSLTIVFGTLISNDEVVRCLLP